MIKISTLDGCIFKTSCKTKNMYDFSLFYHIYTRAHANVDAVDQGNKHVHVKWITIFLY